MISTHPIDERTVAPPPSFYAHLAEGLHAAAQPLTVLLAGLSKEHIETLPAEELRELVAGSAAEVERVCTLFHHLQELVAAESLPPDLAPASILTLVQQVVASTRLLFEQDGIALIVAAPVHCPSLPLDRERTLQALANVLFAAHAISRRNDTVELAVSYPGTHIRVHSRQGRGAAAGLELELGMAVAEAHIRSQHGVFSWNPRPFEATVLLQQLPAAGGER